MGEELRALLGQVDDDYLIGLGNKGILKRAYKDLEQENPVAQWQQEKVKIRLSEETCEICVPLGESTCTCPSRSMCRHIVTAVLWLKKNLGTGDCGGQEAGDGSAAEKAEGAGQAGEAGKEGTPGQPQFAEFLALPLERLKKACGASHYRKLIAHVRTGGLPPVGISSIVTVELPWEQAAVKLLEPLSYSSCTCHSKELCTHKAQALLIWRLKEGACTLEELETGQESESSLDPVQMRAACASLREAVKLQLCTGLSRQSPEVSASMERLAVICHRAGLADMERGLRTAAEEYTRYFERQARFREEELLDRLLGLYRLAGRIQGEENRGVLQKLAGTFRDTYEFAGKLRLIGMGSREFKSKAGYEGEIYYFLNEADGRYLTWTDARPVFYEGAGGKRNASENSQAPWGLSCSRRQLFGMEIGLSDARLAPGGRLSASQETKGELLGAKSLYDGEVRERIVWDYRRLLENVFSGEELALVGAVRWGEAIFDNTTQRFSWELFDIQGRHIYVSLRYTREEKLVIRLLERMEKRVREGSYASLVIFGSLYQEEGRLCLYPIEFWLQEEDGLLCACGQKASPEAGVEAAGEETAGTDKTMPAGMETVGGADTATEAGTEAPAGMDTITAADTEASPGKELPLPSREALDMAGQYLKETERNLADLFVSGITSSSEELEGRIMACSAEGEELGLHYAGEKLAELAGLLRGRHHQMEFSPEPLLEAWEGLQFYLRACRGRVSLDRVRLSLEAGGE